MEQLKSIGIYKWAELQGYKVAKVSYNKSFARNIELEKSGKTFKLEIKDILNIPSSLELQEGDKVLKASRDISGCSLVIQPVEAELIEQSNGKVFDTLKLTKKDYLKTMLSWKKQVYTIDELVSTMKNNKHNKDLSKSIKAFIQLLMLRGFEGIDFKLNDSTLESFKKAVIKYVLEYNETNGASINMTSFESKIKENLIDAGILKPVIQEKKKSWCPYSSVCLKISSCMYEKCQFRPIINGEPHYLDVYGKVHPMPLKKLGIYKWAELKGYTNLKVTYGKGYREVSFTDDHSLRYCAEIKTLDDYTRTFVAYRVENKVTNQDKPKEFSGVVDNGCLFVTSSSSDRA